MSVSKKIASYLRSSLFVLIMLAVLNPGSTLAISAAQKKAFQGGALYANTDETAASCGAPAASPASPSATGTGKVFVIGDSLTYGMTKSGGLLDKLSAAGYTVTTDYDPIPGATSATPRVSGPSVEATGSINTVGTIANLADHKTDITAADKIIIGLGTNREPDFVQKITNLITAIRNTPTSAQIYWINTYYTGTTRSTPYTQVNEEISTAAASNSFSVLDIAAATALDASLAPDGGDGVHFGGDGYGRRAEFVVRALGTAASTAPPAVSPGASCCSVGGTPLSPAIVASVTWGKGVWGSGSPVYQSGLNGPYTLEVWAISMLRNIARKSGVAESSLVTQPKVIALIAFAQGEGGGFDGHNGTYNPLNTKLNHADLHGANQGNPANDSNSNGFPSFDQGVEAGTRAIFNGVQKRIAAAILDPNTTPEQFVEAVAGNFYSEDGRTAINGWEAQFPGDKIWAAGSATGLIYNPATGAAGNHTTYLTNKLNTLNYVRNNYSNVAGTVLDLPNRVSDTRTPLPPLVYTSDGVTGASPGGCAAPPS